MFIVGHGSPRSLRSPLAPCIPTEPLMHSPPFKPHSHCSLVEPTGLCIAGGPWMPATPPKPLAPCTPLESVLSC